MMKEERSVLFMGRGATGGVDRKGTLFLRSLVADWKGVAVHWLELRSKLWLCEYGEYGAECEG